jgi:hypothetical protein
LLFFSLGGGARLRSLSEATDFRDVEITTETHRFALPFFDAYFASYEQVRRAVREEVRRDLAPSATGRK